MRKLTEQEIERIVSLLREGKPLPEDYKAILFDTKKDMNLFMLARSGRKTFLPTPWPCLCSQSRPSETVKAATAGRICSSSATTFRCSKPFYR